MTKNGTHPTEEELAIHGQLQDVNLKKTRYITLADGFPLDFPATAEAIESTLKKYGFLAYEDMREHSTRGINLENLVAMPHLFLTERVMLSVSKPSKSNLLPLRTREKIINRIRMILEEKNKVVFLRMDPKGRITRTEIDFVKIAGEIEDILYRNHLAQKIDPDAPNSENCEGSSMAVVLICIKRHNERIHREAQRWKQPAGSTLLRLPSLESIDAMRKIRKDCGCEKR